MAVCSELRAQAWGSRQKGAGAGAGAVWEAPAPLHSPELTLHSNLPLPCSFSSPGHPGRKGQSALLTAGHRVGTQDRAILPLSRARVS